MKKFRTFNMNKWKEARDRTRAERRKFLLHLAKHPLIWFILIIGVVYGSAALGIGQ